MSTPTHISSNLKFLRQRSKQSQQALADALGIKRSTLSAYENKAAEPTLNTLLGIADHFGYTVDLLLRESLEALPAHRISEIENAQKPDLHGKRLRVIATTVDEQERENIEVVSQKARAGYSGGYDDPEFIRELPRYQLPFLDRNKTYRTFQISGDSMLPIQDGAWVTGCYVEDWTKLKDGERCIILLKEDGIVFKLVYNRIKSDGSLTLVSQNPLYAPYEVKAEDVLEVWQYEHHLYRLEI